LQALDGLDSLLSIVQMPAGVPVATVSINGARNAGLLAVKMLAANTDDDAQQLRDQLTSFATTLKEQAQAKGANMRSKLASPDKSHYPVSSGFFSPTATYIE